MQNQLINKDEALNVIKDLFAEEYKTLRIQPVNEQFIIGSKLSAIEIELQKRIKKITRLNPQSLDSNEKTEEHSERS